MLGHHKHVPVLLDAVLKYLDPQPGESYLDLTAGYGGHATAVLERTLNSPAVLVDRDNDAVKYLHQRFSNVGVDIKHQDFAAASQQLAGQGQAFDLILADLGLSSAQLAEEQRGFAFGASGPLDMRMDRRQALSAAEIVNRWPADRLEQLLTDFGQQPKARAIARRIVAARPVNTTAELAALVSQVAPQRFGRGGPRRWRRDRPGGSQIHPATRVFQALRIAVNDELGQLARSLPLWLRLLKPGGRLAVISFHSLEDRLVKNFLAEYSRAGYERQLRLLTKKPVTATTAEIATNPRARSAKLRAVAKIKTIERK